jgi:hypothetical protein
MFGHDITLEQRHAALLEFIEHRLKQGFFIVSQSETSAELYKPPGFPAFLHKEESLYVVVDESGRLWVEKSNY